MPVQTLLTNDAMLRDSVVPLVDELEASVAELAARAQLVPMYLPDLIGLNADSGQFRLPGVTGWTISRIRVNCYKARDAATTVTVQQGGVAIGTGVLNVTSLPAGALADLVPTTNNVINGSALQYIIGGGNTNACDGNLLFLLTPPAT